jgi:hypothetical protein
MSPRPCHCVSYFPGGHIAPFLVPQKPSNYNFSFQLSWVGIAWFIIMNIMTKNLECERRRTIKANGEYLTPTCQPQSLVGIWVTYQPESFDISCLSSGIPSLYRACDFSNLSMYAIHGLGFLKSQAGALQTSVIRDSFRVDTNCQRAYHGNRSC